MRAHGWAGSPPVDATEARARILDATRQRLAEFGTTSTAEIAERLGVTRQTVYRYFPATEDLLNAAATQAVAELAGDLVEHVRAHLAATDGDAGDAAVEVVAYVFENLRDNPALNRLLAPGRMSGTVANLTATSSIDIGRNLIAGFGIDWEALGWDEGRQRELVEHLLRTLQSLVLDPGEPPRSGAELRAYLQRWLAPALR
ncbi:TetR/AcrR family transcriptional regulator [Saccharopolyspora sp. HNM0983]|uniref:TetR/AcrR family transcriptional regulator n=1 Tax=Saccharopolyspora montiporae TaxID=2781240 RepID=A0A929BCI4_9PSEU|nr:TetR/AcrR family transcriptional regulator [Saccharopolyspora sp. HNM0983]MBE9375553.1 TetR/AcrR family transcriptional regulator [Saccharopolyspora sp. HNM0983]